MRAVNLMLLASLVSLSAEAGSVLKVDTKDAAGKTVPKEIYYAQDGMRPGWAQGQTRSKGGDAKLPV